MRRVVRVLAATSRVVKVGACVAIVLGVLLLGVGAWLEGRGFWDTRPFLINVYSAGATALVGIPIAVVLISAITDAGLKHQSRLQLQTLLRQVAGEIGGLPASIMRSDQEIKQLDWLRKQLTRLHTSRPDRSRGLAHETSGTSQVVEWDEQVIGQWEATLWPAPSVREQFQTLASQWALLKSLKHEAIRSGYAWLHPDLERSIDRLAVSALQRSDLVAVDWKMAATLRAEPNYLRDEGLREFVRKGGVDGQEAAHLVSEIMEFARVAPHIAATFEFR